MDWADELAARVSGPQVVNDSKTPSGTVHVGSLRGPVILDVIARAITPPRRKRRYDTRFFTADASSIAHKIEGKVGPDAEFVELVWVPLKGIKEKIELLAITEIVLLDLQKQIEAGFSHDLPVPFYRVMHGKRVRELL